MDSPTTTTSSTWSQPSPVWSLTSLSWPQSSQTSSTSSLPSLLDIISWRISICGPVSPLRSSEIFSPQWQDFISPRICICLSTPRSLNFSIPLAEFHQLKILNRASTVQESTSVNLSFSTGRIGFSTLMAGLHLFKNLLLSAYHSPTKKKWISPPQWQGFI